MTTITVDFTKPKTIKKSYDLKKYDTVKIVTEGNDNFLDGIESAKASGNTLTIKAMGKTITFKNISSDIRVTAFGLGSEYYNESFETFYFADKFGNTEKTWLAKTSSTSVTGTAFGETINLSGDGAYVPTSKNLTKKVGVTINAGAGDDKIYGTKYNDTITGGTGENHIYLSSSDFGDDTIKLTKGEKLNIKTTGEGTVSYDKDKKGNIIVTAKNTESETTGTLTITGLAKKDVTQCVTINGEAIVFDFDKDNIAKNKITGTAQNDEIDIKDLDGLTKTVGKGKNKHQELKTSEDAGITITSRTGDDIITGSKYSDTITGVNVGR